MFCVELVRQNSEAIRFYDSMGNLLYNLRVPDIMGVIYVCLYKFRSHWRPRHLPCLTQVEEEEKIRKSNLKELKEKYGDQLQEILSIIADRARKNLPRAKRGDYRNKICERGDLEFRGSCDEIISINGLINL